MLRGLLAGYAASFIIAALASLALLEFGLLRFELGQYFIAVQFLGGLGAEGIREYRGIKRYESCNHSGSNNLHMVSFIDSISY
jgi:hypothetical protein